MLSELNHIQKEIYYMLFFISRRFKRVKFNTQLILLTVWKGERGKIDGIMDVKLEVNLQNTLCWLAK